MIVLQMYLVDISRRHSFPVSDFEFLYLQILPAHHCNTLASLHAVIPPIDDVEAYKVEREEHPARLINPEARDANL